MGNQEWTIHKKLATLGTQDTGRRKKKTLIRWVTTKCWTSLYENIFKNTKIHESSYKQLEVNTNRT